MAPNLSLSKVLLLLFYLPIIAAVFQATGMSVAGIFPLVPVVIFQALFVTLLFITLALRPSFQLSSDLRDILFLLTWFLLYSTVSAFVFPYIFEGLPVFNPRFGIDLQVGNETPLVFSVSNIGQALYLFLNSLFLMGGLYLIQGLERDRVLRVFLFSGLTVIFFAVYQKISQLTGIWFPYEIINSNDLYSQGYSQVLNDTQRVSSTFTEPSYAGNVLGTFYVYYLFLLYYGRLRASNWFLFIVYLLGTLITTSSIGYAQLIFGIGLVSVFSLRNPKRFFYAIILVLLVAGGLALNNDVMLALIVNKLDSASFINRFASDKYAFKLFFDTYGLGVGLGGNRPSSFLTYMLSNVGLIGSGLFLMFMLAIVKPVFRNYSALAPEQKALFFGLLSHLFGKLLGVPDLNFWFFWVLLAVSAITFRGPTDKTVTIPKSEKRSLSNERDVGHGA